MKKKLEVPKSVLCINDFGVTIIDTGVQLKVWAPCAIRVRVAIYNSGDDLFRSEIPMISEGEGVYSLCLSHDYINKYYTYILTCAETDYEVVDPYAVASGPNSEKAMIIDLATTDPKRWHTHSRPDPIHPHEAILYELHVRDFSISENSGMENKGKYLAFTELNTNYKSISTGVEHLKELGITHVHLLPIYDFHTVDETGENEYNWGYDPALYNNPEGSYATSTHDGRVRIEELKMCIMALHEAGIHVVLDVVYNHTYHSVHSNFNRLAPGHFYRVNSKGEFTNGSGCGNELATEHLIVRKFIIDSLLFWLREYKVDGFRFDLLGLYDVRTVREIVKAMKLERPDIILYGEPWIGWESALPKKDQFLKSSQRGIDIALFNDDFRNAIKGDNDGEEKGFVMERSDQKPWVELGIAASTKLPGDRIGYADRAQEVVNYVSAHDNLVLLDKIDKVMGHSDFELKKKMHLLSLSIVLTSFGIPFIQAGTEFLRTKNGHENSYNAGDDINKIDWALKQIHMDHFEYVRGLIEFRKSSGFFKWNSAKEIEENLCVLQSPEGVIMYLIQGTKASSCLIIHNGTGLRRPVIAPSGQFKVIADMDAVDLNSTKGYSTRGERPIHIDPYSSMILVGHLDTLKDEHNSTL